VVYAGTYLTHELVTHLIDPLLAEAGVRPLLDAPAGVECSSRSGRGRVLTFVQNTRSEPVAFEGPQGTIALGAYGCTVIRDD
jgi:hypothetical protein